jgi:hypothetical protein
MEKGHLEDQNVCDRITLKCVLKDLRAWKELKWLRIEENNRLLW